MDVWSIQTLRHHFQNFLQLFRVDDDATAGSKNNTVMIKFIEVFRNLLARGTDKTRKHAEEMVRSKDEG